MGLKSYVDFVGRHLEGRRGLAETKGPRYSPDRCSPRAMALSKRGMSRGMHLPVGCRVCPDERARYRRDRIGHTGSETRR